MDFDDNNSNMDEFHWEREFRKDDARIISCMREIPAVVDLPGEYELLMKRVQKQPEYAKGQQSWNDMLIDDFFDFEDISFPDNWRDCEGAEVYSTLESLMEEWCRLFAGDSSEQGVRILCYYGKVMGYAIDLVDFCESKMPELKIALTKRIYEGINSILSSISLLKSQSLEFQKHTRELLKLRQMVLDLRFSLNSQAK